MSSWLVFAGLAWLALACLGSKHNSLTGANQAHKTRCVFVLSFLVLSCLVFLSMRSSSYFLPFPTDVFHHCSPHLSARHSLIALQTSRQVIYVHLHGRCCLHLYLHFSPFVSSLSQAARISLQFSFFTSLRFSCSFSLLFYTSLLVSFSSFRVSLLTSLSILLSLFYFILSSVFPLLFSYYLLSAFFSQQKAFNIAPRTKEGSTPCWPNNKHGKLSFRLPLLCYSNC